MYRQSIVLFLKRFARGLYQAIFFAFAEYDDSLQMEKTPTERLIRWIILIAIVVISLVVVSWLVLQGLESINIIEEGFME